MYSDLGFLDSGEPPRTPFFSLQSPVPRFESGRRLQLVEPGQGLHQPLFTLSMRVKPERIAALNRLA